MSIENLSVKKDECGCTPTHPGKTVPVCVIVEKVYDSCLQKECFPDVCITLPLIGGPFTFVSATFLNGTIDPASIITTPIASTLTARVQFTIEIPYSVTLQNPGGQLVTTPNLLLTINKDIVLYFPPTSSEFDFNLRVETRTIVLGVPTITATTIELAIGSYVISKVTGCVQLQIPEYGFCPIPGPCEDFIPDNPCDNFEESEVPDFFPPQEAPTV
ncbi:MAG TPA: hypothetical protein VFC84_05415 [Desulfosporosinus sp.]|nr:hypothetical protein [Desulfosporosinus sp.]